MSFLAIDQLTNDSIFAGRVRACVTQQSETYKDDARPSFVALADSCLRGETQVNTFTRLVAAGPGIADEADNGSGGVDQSQIGDDDILASVQANFQVVAGLYYNDDGTPIT